MSSPFTPSSPAALGYRMPAEWEPHAGTWLSWPYNLETWEGHLEGAEKAYVEIIDALTPHETVQLLVPNEEIKARALKALGKKRNNLVLHCIETGDVWIRDYGPIFLKRESNGKSEVAYTKWIYNAYGNKYEDLLIGNDAANTMPLQDYKRFDAGIVLEGGSIDVNGTGSLLTTESCLLSPDRNPDLKKEDIEQKLRDFLGVTNILWLSAGIEGDDTTGHIDDLTRFTGQSTVVTVVEENTKDPNYAPLRENLERLKTMRDEKGTLLTIHTLPMPKEFVVEDRRMAASYANFYIANGVVLVPVYKQDSDAEALNVLAKCFPDRKIVEIDCRELIWGYGSVHCGTQQMPSNSDFVQEN
ncbi:MAG: agmatine deiminase [Candidatus Peregrinibacteria bacterium Greene1014_49]|nr:MAG: agmatine deiminase [Candidatus Peregrinibacteria bacterium Greene1014_49]